MKQKTSRFPDFMPFIRIAGPISGTCSLHSKSTYHSIELTNELKNLLSGKKNVLEVRVRLTVSVSPTEREKPVPEDITVRCGNIQAQLKAPHWTKVDGDYVNEAPVEVTALVKPVLNRRNLASFLIIIDLLDDARVSGVAEFFVSRKITYLTLMRSVLRSPALPTDFIENRRQDMKEAGVEFEIVSLKCPCLGVRIKIPARFDTCGHAECFDLDNFLKMEERKPKGRCPVCNKFIELRTMGICQYTADIIDNNPDCESYRISPDCIEPLSAAEAQMASRKRKRDSENSEAVDQSPSEPQQNGKDTDDSVIIID